MPAGAFANFHVYGPAQSAGVVTASAEAIPSASATARLGEVVQGAGSVPLAKPTRLRNSPMVASGFGVMVRAVPKALARPGMVVKIGALSQDDVTGAVLEARVEGDVTLKQALRLLLAYVAGNATGLDGNPIFRSLDGTKDRIAGTISAGNRNVTTVDPS
jgi:hypothetical protein